MGTEQERGILMKKQISHYVLLEKLGVGGMGVVYKARDTILDRIVALKFLSHEISDNVEKREQLLREAQAAAALNHPNIATIYGIAIEEKEVFIVMEYLDGFTLREKLISGPLPIDDVISYSLQIAEGLQAAHLKSIVHRDVTSSNIVVLHDGTVKIMDFGLAMKGATDHSSSNTTSSGTLVYMSPEQARGEQLDARTDIWSIGVVVYEMLTGQTPYKSLYSQAVMYSILNETPLQASDIREDIPPALNTLCMNCMVKDRTQRIQTMDDVVLVLHGLAHPPRAVPVPTRRWSRWNIALIIAAVSAFVACIVWLLFVIFRGTTPVQPRLAVLPVTLVRSEKQVSDWPVLIQSFLINELTGLQEVGVVDQLSLSGLLESEFGTNNPQRGPDLNDLLVSISITTVIDGLLVKSGNEYKIISKIKELPSDSVAYSFETPLKDVDHIAEAVQAISSRITGYFQVQQLQKTDEPNLKTWVTGRTRNIHALKAFMLGSEALYRSDHAAAAECFARAVALDSTFITPRIWMLPYMVMQRRMKEARAHHAALLRLRAHASPFDEAMIDWAGCYLSADLWGQAHSLESALRYSPNNTILQANLASTKYQLEDVQGALDAIKPIVDMRWHYPPIYTLYAQCYYRLGRIEEAGKVLEKSLSWTKDVDPDAYQMLAFIHERRHKTQEALQYEIRAVKRYRELDMDTITILERFGQLALEVKSPAFAKRYFERLIAAQPSVQRFHDELGEALYSLGDKESAYHSFARSLQLDSAWAHAWFMIGRLDEEQGRSDKARKAYTRFLLLDSTSATAKEVEQRLRAQK